MVFKAYLKPVLVKKHEDLKLSDATATALDAALTTLAKSLATSAASAAAAAKRRTVMAKDVEVVARTALKDHADLAGRLLLGASEAVAKYSAATQGSDEGGKHSRSSRAGLVFPVPRTETLLREAAGGARLSEDAVVYLTALLEGIAGGALEDAGRVAKALKKKIVTAKHITDAGLHWKQLLGELAE